MKKVLKFGISAKSALNEFYDFNDDYDDDDFTDDDIVDTIDGMFIQLLEHYGIVGDFCNYSYDQTTGWLKCSPKDDPYRLLYDFYIHNGIINIYEHYANGGELTFTYAMIAFIKNVSLKVGEMKCINEAGEIIDARHCYFYDDTMRTVSHGSDKNDVFAKLIDIGLKQQWIDGIIDEVFVSRLPDMGKVEGNANAASNAFPIFKSKDVYEKMAADPQGKNIISAFTRSARYMPRTYINNLPYVDNYNDAFILVWDGDKFPHYEKAPVVKSEN